MEGVAIGIAKKALASVVSTATTAIADEIGLLLGVQEELFFIKEELEMMQAFLREATGEEVKGETVITWVKQVQELSYDVEDCLQEASVHLMKKGCLNAILSSKSRDHIAQMIKVLKVRIVDVSQRNLRYGLIKSSNKNVLDDSLEKPVLHWNATEEASVVGLNKPKQELLKLISENCDDALKVVLVVGMGGLGKTTLVKSVYANSELSNDFKCFAWIAVLHPLNKEEFILSLATQFSLVKIDSEEEETQKMKKMASFKEGMKKRRFDMGELEKMIIEHVKEKRFILVLDDLANEMEWSKINYIFTNVVNGSRIIVTTRSEFLEAHISQFKVTYKIKPLSKDDSLKLFYRAVFKNSDYSPTTYGNKHNNDHLEENSLCKNITGKLKQVGEVTEESSSHENITGKSIKVGEITEEWSSLENITQEVKHVGKITEEMKEEADKIIERCGQLPLAIVAIGSFLATRPITSTEWKNMHDHITSEIGANPHLGSINKVLTTSYDGLPNNLKPCFLYLSVFHNHQEIRRSRIVRRWMAEGFLMERCDMTAEEVGDRYFYDLMGRSLIQPSDSITIENDVVTRCNIHDLIYELLIAKSEHEKVVSFIGDRSRVYMNDKGRHIVIQDGLEEKNNVLQRMKLSNIRSVTGFGKVGSYVAYHHKMRFLRVLDLEGTLGLKNHDIRKICKLRHLKYLGLRGTMITKLPGSLEKLYDLETLDIRDTWVLDLPKGVVKLKRLSYLRAGFDYYKNPELYDRYKPSRFLEISFYTYVASLLIFCCLPLIGGTYCCETATGEVFKYVKYCKCICGDYIEDAIDGPGQWTNFGSFGLKAPVGMGKMRSLRNFGTVDIGQSIATTKELKYLSNLTKIAIVGFSVKNGEMLGKAIQELIHLKSLFLAASDFEGLGCCLESIKNIPKYLQSLKLFSPIEKLPNWFSSLDNLVKLHLRCTYLPTTAIEEFEMLSNLKILFILEDSIIGEELRFGPNAFPMLQVMLLDCIHGLFGWKRLTKILIVETALQRLAYLTIRDKVSSKFGSILESRDNGSEVLVPTWVFEGMEYLTSLKELVLDNLDVDVVESAKGMISRNGNNTDVRCLNIPTKAKRSN